MITIVARWDQVQMAPTIEWRMWRQLAGAFDAAMQFKMVPIVSELSTITAEQYDTMAEALAACDPAHAKAFLEPTGTKTVAELPTGDIVFVVGNTMQGNAVHALPTEMYRIASPNPTDLFGTDAVAIALAYHYGQ